MQGRVTGEGRRRSGPGRSAVIASVAIHLAVVGGLWVASLSQASPIPPMRAYRVEIVSPPPIEAGPAIPASNPDPEPPPPDPDPAPEPAPEPEPVPPAPTPEPEPSPAPPRPEPEPEPAPRPVEPEPEPAPQPPAPEPEPARDEPAERRPQQSPRPATGQNPQPDAERHGSGLNIRIDGDPFPFPGYLEGIVAQIGRYFRWQGDTGLRAEIYFEIMRDGSVQGIRLLTRSGSAAFDIEAMSAVEQAGRRRAFGPLPEEFTGERLPVSFYFQPAR